MPTYDAVASFWRDWRNLTGEEQARFFRAVERFVEDLGAGRQPRPGLRVKHVQGTRGIFELAWASDGRATFKYGEAVTQGEVHVVWRRIGGHEIFGTP